MNEITKRILFYGNCQLFIIKHTLNLKNIEQYHIECCNTEYTETEFNNIIKKCEKNFKYLVFKIIKLVKILEFMIFLA